MTDTKLTATELKERIRTAIGTEKSLLTVLPAPVLEILMAACSTAALGDGVSANYLYQIIMKETEVA